MKKESETTNHSKQAKLSYTIALVIALAAIVIAVSAMTINSLPKLLYNERANNANALMKKISLNIETVMNKYWETLEHGANILSNTDVKNRQEAFSIIRVLNEAIPNEEGNMVCIDSNGLCYSANGLWFQWSDYSKLPAESHELSIMPIPAFNETNDQMVFIEKMEQPIVTSDITLEYLGLYVDMEDINPYFEAAEYGKDSMMYILQQNGTHVYHQRKDNILSKIYNLDTRLQHWKYLYGTSADKIQNELHSGVAGCVCINVEGQIYYILYHPLEVNDWSAVLLLPESSVSSGSEGFMNSIIRYMIFLGLTIIVVLIIVVILVYRNRHIQERQLAEQMKKAAEAEHAANIAKTQFLSTMSHDIRTPLNAILGMVTIAYQHLNEEDYVRDCLDKIRLSGNHLLTLINDILDISKIEAGKIVIKPVNTSLANLTIDISDIFSSRAKDHGVDFRIEIKDLSNEYLMVDDVRLNQILINLVGNAIKFTPEGGRAQLTIREESVPDKPDMTRLILVIEDNGIGMSKEFMKGMYATFNRANDSRVDKIVGTGLGLSICKQIVDLMDGTIECESELEKGTRFAVTLELPIGKEPKIKQVLCDKKVLIYSQDSEKLNYESSILKKLGGFVDSADNFSDFLKKAKDYDLYLLPLKSEEVPCNEAVRILRDMVGNTAQILMEVIRNRDKVEETVIAMGADGYLTYPFFCSSTRRELQKYLNKNANPDKNDIENTTLSDLHILVAEDNDLNWEVANEILSMHGIASDRAENGKECVNIMESVPEGTYDLILMDVQMPVMNGRDATRAIRALNSDYAKQIPILAVTADAFSEDIRLCLESGMDGHISKPIDLKQMLHEIQRVRHEKQDK